MGDKLLDSGAVKSDDLAAQRAAVADQVASGVKDGKAKFDEMLVSGDVKTLLANLRKLYTVNAVLLLITGVFGMFNVLTLAFMTALMAFYVCIFAGLILVHELKLTYRNADVIVKTYFKFLSTFAGRAIFITMCGLMTWDSAHFFSLGTFTAIFSLLNGFLNLYIMNQHPEFKTDPAAAFGPSEEDK